MSNVGHELNVSLEQARVRLELYLERGDNLDPLTDCADMLHQIRGVLSVVELYGAAQLADEMEKAIRFIVEAPAVPRGDALEVLSRALVQLPIYIERIMAGARDIPFVLLPLLNDLRTVRGAPLLNENTLFLLNVSHNEPPPEALTSRPETRSLADLCKTLRPRFQASLLGWITGNDARNHLKVLLAISIEMENAAREPSVHRLWRVVGALLEALRDGGLESGAAIKRLLGQVDQHIRQVIELGETGVARNPPDDLVNNILYYVGRARGGGHRVKDVKRAFDLEKLLPEPDRVVRERDGLAGPSPDLMRTVGMALKDDLSQVKDGLDIFMRTGRKNPEDLQAQRELLKKIGDTLSMLGLGRLRRDIEIESARLARMVTGAVEPDENSLMEIAATLLKLEDKLDKELLQLIDPRREPGSEDEDSEDDADYRAVARAVIGECLVNLARVKDAIVSFVAHSDDPNILEDVSGLMRGIRSAMLLLEKDRVSDLVSRIGDYVQHHIRFSGKAPGGAQVERVADAIVSLEYYLETLKAGRADPWYMLDNAEASMQALRRADELPDFESGSEAIARGEPTASITQLYREGVGDFDHVGTTQITASPTRVLRKETRKVEVFSPGERSDPEFLELFIEEAKEETAVISKAVARLKDTRSDKDALQTLRRSFHTLKGSGRMVGAQLIGEYAWSVENLLNRVIEGTVSLDEAFEFVDSAARAVPELVEQLEVGTDPDVDIDAMMSKAWAFVNGEIEAEKTTVAPRLDEQRVSEEQETEATRVMPSYPDAHKLKIPRPLVAIEMDSALLEIFAKETASHLKTLREFIKACADREAPFALNEDVRRAAHTLHGSANMASVAEIVAIAAPLDQYVSESFNAGQRVPEAALKVLAEAADVIEAQVACINQPSALPDTAHLQSQIAELQEAAGEPEVPTEGLEVSEFEVLDTEDDGDTIVTRLVEVPGQLKEQADGSPQTREDASPETEAAEPPVVDEPVSPESSETRLMQRLPEQPELAEPPVPQVPEQPDDSETRVMREVSELPELPEAPEQSELAEPPVLQVPEQSDDSETRVMREVPELPQAEASAPQPELPELDETVQQQAPPEPVYPPFSGAAAEQPESLSAGVSYDQEIAGIFVEEAGELLDNADAALQALNTGGERVAALDDLKRQLHTLKGGARMAGIAVMGDLSHELESLLQREDTTDTGDADALLPVVQESIDRLHLMREQVSDGEELTADEDLLARLRDWTRAALAEPETQAPATDTTHEDSPAPTLAADEAQPQEEQTREPESPPQEVFTAPVVEPVRPRFAEPPVFVPPEPRVERHDRARVDAELLQRLLDNAGEISIFRARIEQQINSVGFNLAELSQTVTRLRDQLRKLEIETEAQILFRHQGEEPVSRGDFDPLELDRYSNIQQLSRSLSETTGDLMSIQELLDNLVKEADNLLVQQSRVATELQHGLMRARMVPFQQGAQRLGRVVRQTAGEAGKQVELNIEGGQGEMDRQMLERMMPVLEHMARNSVIHGIEDRDERARQGKPDEGNITIKLRREGAETVIEFADDGRGLDLERIQARAVQHGLVAEGDALSEAQVMQLVFEPGLSTATEVTQTAGRGVGMDVAANEVRQLGGSIHIESRSGQGARFIVRLPFTLAISQALLVNTADETYALPLTTVEGVTRLPVQSLISAWPPSIRPWNTADAIILCSTLVRCWAIRRSASLTSIWRYRWCWCAPVSSPQRW